MDYVGNAEKVLTAMRQFTSLITPPGGETGDSFIGNVGIFAQNAISTLEQMEQYTKKQLNLILNCILSTAWLVVQNMSSKATLDAIKGVTQEVRGLLDGGVPEYMARDYDELERLLAAASEKLAGIQSTCNFLLEEVKRAFQRQGGNPINFRHLEATRLKASFDLKICEQSLKRADQIIELLQRKTSEQLVKLGFGFAFFAAITIGSLGVALALQLAARIKGGMYCASASGALCCVAIGNKLSHYYVFSKEVEAKYTKHRQLSTELELLKKTVEEDLEEEALTTRMTALAN